MGLAMFDDQTRVNCVQSLSTSSPALADFLKTVSLLWVVFLEEAGIGDEFWHSLFEYPNYTPG